MKYALIFNSTQNSTQQQHTTAHTTAYTTAHNSTHNITKAHEADEIRRDPIHLYEKI